MGAGGKEVSLDVFESHLKKLLHIIDKLPKVEREKAVLILRNSANHYSNITSGQHIPPPTDCPVLYSSVHPCNQALSEIPVSQVTKTFDLLKEESLLKHSGPHLRSSILGPQSASEVKSESQAILEEIGGLAEEHGSGAQDEFMDDGEDWDQHILDLDETDPNSNSNEHEMQAAPELSAAQSMSAASGLLVTPDLSATSVLSAAPVLLAAPGLSASSSLTAVSSLSAAPDRRDRANLGLMDIQTPQDDQLPPNSSNPSGKLNTSVQSSLFERIESSATEYSQPRTNYLERGEPEPTSMGVEETVNKNTSFNNSDSEIQCKMCFKRLDVSRGQQPVSCRVCRTVACGTECFLIHSQECQDSREPKKSRSSTADGKKSKKKQEYKCDTCDKFFLTSVTLKTHMEGHAKNDCEKCSTKCATRRILVSHMKQVHFINVAEKYYPCKYCPRKFAKKPSLWFHYNSHATGKQVVCLKCGQFLENKDQMEKHTISHRESGFTCDRCGDFFARRQQYNLHVKTHDNHQCTVCSKSFSSKKLLKLHGKEHNEGGEDQTQDSSRPSNPKTGGTPLKQTKVVAKSWKKSFKCGYCNFENKNYKKVVRHEKRHKNYRAFVCELCGNAYNSEYNLKEHTFYVHSDERNFKCSKCDKAFKAKNALIRHEQVHTEQRQFHCPCGKSYKRQSHLNRHFSASSHGYSSAAEQSAVGPKAEYSAAVEEQVQDWSQEHVSVHKKSSDQNQGSTERSYKLELKSTESLSDFHLNPSISNSYPKSSNNYSRRTLYLEKGEDYEKLKHYKIPKKYSSFYPEKPRGSQYPEYNDDLPRGETNRPNQHSNGKYQWYDVPATKHHYPPQHVNQRHYQTDSLERGVPGERVGSGFSEKHHGDYQTKPLPGMEREFMERYPTHDKMDYSSSLSDKPYEDFESKNYIISDDLEDRHLSHSEDRIYVIPEVIEDRQIGQSGSQEKPFLPMDNRLFHSNVREPSYCQPVDSRMLGSLHDFRPDSVIPDSGPADLTITAKDVSRNDSRASSGDYFGGIHASSSGRHSFSKPRAPTPHASSSRVYQEPSRTHYMSQRNSDLFRQPHPDSRPQPAINQLESLEEAAYRPLQDLGYSRQQNLYYDQMDPYVLLSRSVDIDENYDKRARYYRQDKYARNEELNLLGPRQDGGLLPPLLALAPSLPPGHNSAPSPPNMKLDYICSPTDHIGSQYISDSALDYY